MMRLEIKINIICAVMIFISFFVIPYFVMYNNKIGGNILNEGSEIVNDEYYVVDNDGNKNKITKEEWNKCKIITIAFFVVVSLASISVFYFFCRYIFIPSFTKHFHSIIDFISRIKK